MTAVRPIFFRANTDEWPTPRAFYDRLNRRYGFTLDPCATAENAKFGRDTAEAALAHVVSDKTEAAYQRGTLFGKRRELMKAWADYCGATS